MKPSVKLLFVLAFTSALMARAAFGQAFSFDENGNATGPGTVPGALAPEPISGIVTLAYPLPFPVTLGDIFLPEPGAPPGTRSDRVRFENIGPNGYLFFFSDNQDGGSDLADVANLYFPDLANNVTVPEIGPEGDNAGTWTPVPGSGQPGDPGFAVTYTLISDVPEPSSLLLAGLGGAMLLALRRRRSAK